MFKIIFILSHFKVKRELLTSKTELQIIKVITKLQAFKILYKNNFYTKLQVFNILFKK